MMKILKICYVLVLLVCLTAKANAYSSPGHWIIAKIAFDRLDPAVRSNVLQALDGMSFEQASTWMDDVRQDKNYTYLRSWHYINIPAGESYKPMEGDNLMNALHRAFDDFRSGVAVNEEQLKLNTLLVFHLIGDLHQPLHVGYADDRGGNDYQVNINGYGTNLHKVWDEYLISKQKVTYESCTALLNGLPEQDVKTIAQTDMVAWWNESRALLGDIYNIGGEHKMSDDYLVRMKPVVEMQLVKAGVRLAGVLNEFFKEPIAVTSTPPAERRVIEDADAINHVGEKVTVCGKVYTTRFLDYSAKKPTFLNLGAAYPNQTFTIVIYGPSREKFSYQPEERLKNQNVCVTGRVQLYKNKPQIILNEPEQLKIQ